MNRKHHVIRILCCTDRIAVCMSFYGYVIIIVLIYCISNAIQKLNRLWCQLCISRIKKNTTIHVKHDIFACCSYFNLIIYISRLQIVFYLFCHVFRLFYTFFFYLLLGTFNLFSEFTISIKSHIIVITAKIIKLCCSTSNEYSFISKCRAARRKYTKACIK